MTPPDLCSPHQHLSPAQHKFRQRPERLLQHARELGATCVSTAPLRRLGTDYVDPHQILRMDNATPAEETLEALHDVVQSGKARDLGTIAWSPLARGRLARDWDEATGRSA
ncbi:MAG: aldo/keto reductase, partial [Streptosporangiaceae bacterium]